MTDTKVSCSYENGSYVINLYGDESLLDPKEIFFENEELLVNKENLVSYCLYSEKKKHSNISIKINNSDLNSDISHLTTKSKIKQYIFNRFTNDQLGTIFFKKRFFPKDFTIKEFQKEGIVWLKDQPGRLLADDMGLGKTAQSLVAATELIKNNDIKNVLIVCPSSLMQNWADEIKIWAKSFKGYQVTSKVNDDGLWKGIIGHGHFYIVNYDQLRKVSNVLLNKPPDLIICDEAHKLRKKTSQIHKGLKKLSQHSKRFWALTGTPIEKNTDDLISIMQIVTPNVFNSSTRKLSPIAIKGIVKKDFLRRLKSSVLDDLSDIKEQTIYLELNAKQQTEYQKIKKRMVLTAGKDILKYFNDLRSICDEYNGSSIKYDCALDIIEKIKYKKEKVVIFSYTISPLESLKSILDKEFSKKASIIFEGGMDLNKRNKAITNFKKSDETFVLLCSGKIAGEGLNLTEANNVIFLNEWWNPSSNNQARDRVHRIGQTKDVMIFNLRTKNTIEESLDVILKEKRSITEEVVEGMIYKELKKNRDG